MEELSNLKQWSRSIWRLTFKTSVSNYYCVLFKYFVICEYFRSVLIELNTYYVQRWGMQGACALSISKCKNRHIQGRTVCRDAYKCSVRIQDEQKDDNKARIFDKTSAYFLKILCRNGILIFFFVVKLCFAWPPSFDIAIERDWKMNIYGFTAVTKRLCWSRSLMQWRF